MPVLTGVDEFDEQGEVIAELFVDLLANEQLLVFVNQLDKRQSLIDIIDQTSIDSHALMAWHTADLPTLADVRLCGIDAFKRCDLVTTPDGGLQIWLEFVGFHLFWLQR